MVDFYFNSWRLVPANVLWGVGLLAVALAALAWAPAIALVVFLAVPVAGLHFMAALIQRERPVAFSDFVEGMRRYGLAAIVVGALSLGVGVVLTTNVLRGLLTGEPFDWAISTLALYGLFALAMFLVAAWPIVVDPLRAELPLRQRLKLAAQVVVSMPARMLALTVLILVVLVISTVLFAALLTVSIAYVSLVGTRYVLPAADRLEGRATKLLPVE